MRTISPIKARALRQAGESLRDRLYELFFEKLFFLYVAVAYFWMMAFTEWMRSVRATEPDPALYTLIASGVTIYAVIRSTFLVREARRVKLGWRGEQVVGEYLNRLVAKGYRVYHDIPTGKGNIDHVIICSRGVFTIETKTRRKPATGEAIVTYDGSALSFNGRCRDDSAIRQSLAQSGWLKTMLKEETGQDYPVRPVIVVPGWFVERMPAAGQSPVWALNPKALHKWIDHGPVVLEDSRVKLAATRLGKYVRSHSN